ncbi:hypothetical protein CEXT_804631 [Caerostris extrusa]|uniref:Uncharacterized protein n=1 Tax=Caerostris extrusa TaxID=172846 RepID=A0AAV4UC82_CAEEX|nr:hypothetical protein CEXT_804631 [Caerostris extrusa]
MLIKVKETGSRCTQAATLHQRPVTRCFCPNGGAKKLLTSYLLQQGVYLTKQSTKITLSLVPFHKSSRDWGANRLFSLADAYILKALLRKEVLIRGRFQVSKLLWLENIDFRLMS